MQSAAKRAPVPTGDAVEPYLRLKPVELRDSFDRHPFAFSHRLHSLDMFKFGSLVELAAKFTSAPRDYFVAGSAPTAGTKFYTVPNGGFAPGEALNRLDKGSYRLLLKRPENHDQAFRELLEDLFSEVVGAFDGLRREQIRRLESAILISSGSTTTPIHFDPEIGFFSQIEGEKFYHIYPPSCASEAEMERFYVRGRVDIAQVELEKLDREKEQVFRLLPGMGFHQPQNSPHWVRTGDSRSVSYTFVLETGVGRTSGRARGFNFCLRKLGVRPAAVGTHRRRDALKAAAMRLAYPVQFLGRILNKLERVAKGPRVRDAN
jgi:hypothetical protein